MEIAYKIVQLYDDKYYSHNPNYSTLNDYLATGKAIEYFTNKWVSPKIPNTQLFCITDKDFGINYINGRLCVKNLLLYKCKIIPSDRSKWYCPDPRHFYRPGTIVKQQFSNELFEMYPSSILAEKVMLLKRILH